MTIAAGITTCNEERTIGPLLERLLPSPGIISLTVVSSACRDRTDEIVKDFAARDSRVRLISEPERRGKSAAVNTFLSHRPACDLTLLSSGDVLPAEGTVEAIAGAFADPQTGMAGGRPSPVNDPGTLTGAMAHLLWNLHHRIALETPKLGELVVFRSALVEHIPAESPVDEASIEAAVRQAGYALRYVPEAAVYNRGPSTPGEWLAQRRRIAYGHRWLARREGYHVSTANGSSIARALGREIAAHPGQAGAALTIVGLEILARLLARTDEFRSPGRHVVWDIAETTKTGNTPA